jgi:transcriptional regulator with XRE-family HTH domain
MATFGKRLRDARIESGLTQGELAERVGIDPSEISRWEAGDRTKNHERFLRRVWKAAKALRTDPAHLAFGSEPDLDRIPSSDPYPGRGAAVAFARSCGYSEQAIERVTKAQAERGAADPGPRYWLDAIVRLDEELRWRRQ